MKSHVDAVILAYHLIDRQPSIGITWTTPSQFDQQMGWLADRDYRTCSLSQLIDSGDSLPSKRVIITFDDGYASLARYALNSLARRGFTATVFPVTGYIGKQNRWDVNFLGYRKHHLDWGALQALLAAGWEIGSHTITHAFLPHLSAIALQNELSASRELLEQKLAIPIHHLSLPFGRGNRSVFETAARTGYQSVATLGQGGILQHTKIKDYRREGGASRQLHILPRRGVYLHDTLKSFRRRIEAPISSQREYYRQRAISLLASGTIFVKELQALIGAPKKELES